MLLLLACAATHPDPWAGVPLQRDARPDWAAGLALDATVGTFPDGHRLAARVIHPLLSGAGNFSAATAVRTFHAEWRPAGGTTRTWELTLDPDPDRLPGIPITLSPNGADVVGEDGGGFASGVVRYGAQSFAFRCAGDGADLRPTGWCLDFLRQTWVEVWEG